MCHMRRRIHVIRIYVFGTARTRLMRRIHVSYEEEDTCDTYIRVRYCQNETSVVHARGGSSEIESSPTRKRPGILQPPSCSERERERRREREGWSGSSFESACVCVCVCARVRVYACVCVHVCMRASVHACVRVSGRVSRESALAYVHVQIKMRWSLCSRFSLPPSLPPSLSLFRPSSLMSFSFPFSPPPCLPLSLNPLPPAVPSPETLSSFPPLNLDRSRTLSLSTLFVLISLT
jgi:hypothetical protein